MNRDRAPEPVTIWCVLLAWACCSVTWFVTVFTDGWWTVPTAVLLMCLSLVVALFIDARRLTDWANDDEDE